MSGTRLRIIAVNDADAATVTVSPAVFSVGDLAADNIQDERRSRVLRTTTAGDQVINLTWTVDVLIRGVVVGQHNLTEDATVRVQIYSDAAMTTEIYDSGTLDALFPVSLGGLDFGVDPLGVAAYDYTANNTPVWMTTPQTGRAVKITLSDSTNPDGYLQVGRVFAGRYIEPSVNMDLGYILRQVDTTKQLRTQGGSLIAVPGISYRRVKFNLSWLSDGDRERFYKDFASVGRTSQVYVSLFPEGANAKEAQHQMIAKCVVDQAYRGSRQIFSDVSYEFEEA